MHDRVVVKRVDEEQKSKGGIIIPETAQEKPMQGEIIAVGPGARDESGKVVALDVKKGDRLFTIDPVPFQLIVNQRQAQIDEQKALLKVSEEELSSARAALATAERSNLQGQNRIALTSARSAMAGLPAGTPDFIRAQDIAMQARAAIEQQRKRT